MHQRRSKLIQDQPVLGSRKLQIKSIQLKSQIGHDIEGAKMR